MRVRLLVLELELAILRLVHLEGGVQGGHEGGEVEILRVELAGKGHSR